MQLFQRRKHKKLFKTGTAQLLVKATVGKASPWACDNCNQVAPFELNRVIAGTRVRLCAACVAHFRNLADSAGYERADATPQQKVT